MEWIIVFLVFIVIAVFTFVLPVAVIGGIGFAIVKSAGNTSYDYPGWQEAAEELGLDYDSGSWSSYPSIAGDMEGVEVEIRVNQKGGSRHTLGTAYTARLGEPWQYGQRLVTRGFFDDLTSLVEGEEVRIEHPAFDEVYRLSGRPSQELQTFLNQQPTADCFLALAEDFERVWVANRELRLEASARVRDKDVLVRNIRTLAAAVKELEGIFHRGTGVVETTPDGDDVANDPDDVANDFDDVANEPDDVATADDDGGFSNVAW